MRSDSAPKAWIEFHGVDFSYPARKDFKSLDGLNLIIPSGKVTAIVGGSIPFLSLLF